MPRGSRSLLDRLGPPARRQVEATLIAARDLHQKNLARKAALEGYPTEDDFQIAVAKRLDAALPEGTLWWHTPNGGKRSKGVAGKLKAMGVKPGVPDVLILHAGLLYCIELKQPGNSPSPQQRDFHAALKSQGVPIAVAQSLAEVEEAVAAFGIPLADH